MKKEFKNINIMEFVTLSEPEVNNNNNIIGEVFVNENGRESIQFKVNGQKIDTLSGLSNHFININRLKEKKGNKVAIVTMNPMTKR